MALSLAKERSRFLLVTLILLIFLLGFSAPLDAFSHSDPLERERLSISSSEFVSSLRAIFDILQQVGSILSKFASFFGDFRLSNAVHDCLDLIDLTSDALSWSMSAVQNPNGRHNSTGHLSSDVRTWLSSAITNPETCQEGFEGTNGMVKGLVSAGLSQVSSLVASLLTNVNPGAPQFASEGKNQIPHWVKPQDRKLLQANGVVVDAIVAADGTGNFTKIMDAVLSAPDYSMKRYVIYIKRGLYKENVEIKKKKWNLMMIGDGMDATIISGNRNYIDGWTTFRTATFAVSGRGFIAKDIRFENTAGPAKHQAVALRVDSDLSAFYRCAVYGYQDTLYTHTMRQFYRECRITGTVDFIFGDATAVFQKCLIQAKKGLPDQKNTITAQGRKDPNEPTGFVIQFCNITADTDLVPFVNTTHTYLGRPWKLYSRTIFMQNYMSDVLRPEGWLEWNGAFALDTLYYAELMNNGPGAGVGKRVKWPGYHALNASSEANNFTVAQFIEGNSWLPSTGVAYTAGFGG